VSGVSIALLVTYILLWILLAALTVAVFALYHHFGEMYLSSREGRARDGPELHRAIKPATVRDLAGEEVRVPRPAVATMLFYATTNCPLCTDLLPALTEVAARERDIETVVVCGNEPPAVAAWADGLSSAAVVVPDGNRALATRYRINATPFLVLIDRDGVVRGKGIVNGRDGLEQAVQRLEAAHTDPDQGGET
jgi:methylamine dehydrogenase accessory protein MauD